MVIQVWRIIFQINLFMHKNKQNFLRLLFLGFLIFGFTKISGASDILILNKLIDAQNKTQNLTSYALLIENIWNDGSRMNSVATDTLQRAIDVRLRCINDLSRDTGKSIGIFCPAEVKSLKLLNEQLVGHMKLQRLGSLGLARKILCLSAESVKLGKSPKSLTPVLKPNQEMILQGVVAGIKDVYVKFNDDTKSAIDTKCNDSSRSGGEDFSSTLGKISLEAWSQEAFQVVSKNCKHANGRLSTNDYSDLRDALNSCASIDRYGVDTETEAANILSKLKDSLEREERHEDAQAWRDANTKMLAYTSFVYRKLTPLYLEGYAPRCPDGSQISWSEANPWRLEFSCFFGPSEYHYFNPFAGPGQLTYSTNQELNNVPGWPLQKKMESVEVKSLQWMRNFIKTYTLARASFFNECTSRTKSFSRPLKHASTDVIGRNVILTCVASNSILLQASFQIDSQGGVGQAAQILINTPS